MHVSKMSTSHCHHLINDGYEAARRNKSKMLVQFNTMATVTTVIRSVYGDLPDWQIDLLKPLLSLSLIIDWIAVNHPSCRTQSNMWPIRVLRFELSALHRSETLWWYCSIIPLQSLYRQELNVPCDTFQFNTTAIEWNLNKSQSHRRFLSYKNTIFAFINIVLFDKKYSKNVMFKVANHLHSAPYYLIFAELNLFTVIHSLWPIICACDFSVSVHHILIYVHIHIALVC